MIELETGGASGDVLDVDWWPGFVERELEFALVVVYVDAPPFDFTTRWLLSFFLLWFGFGEEVAPALW